MDKMPRELLIHTLRKVYVTGGKVAMWPLLFVCKKWTVSLKVFSQKRVTKKLTTALM
jgi:hypothetical protein